MTTPDLDAVAVRLPSVRSQPSVEVNVLEGGFGDGYAQDVTEGVNSTRRSWNLVWQGLTETHRNNLVDFIEARRGVEPFTWTAPGDGAPRKWTCRRWNPGKPERGGRFDVTAEFREDFTL